MPLNGLRRTETLFVLFLSQGTVKRYHCDLATVAINDASSPTRQISKLNDFIYMIANDRTTGSAIKGTV